ncbi:MAG TPA: LLM class flavin-dependent oxidoreductase [Chloroflexota bacterium]|jgi:alkanesulfonate monooxygenase SsuD/methylene tetrahydromethanopterin reductase-like flavin-dependent oxidoreductase (luciferase family)
MRFSIIGAPRQRWDLGETAAQAWWDWIDDALLAEKLGFDAVYTGEHHFCFASGNSSPFLLLTNVAARTERIRVGTSVICAPFHNPLRLAEDIAALDIVSRGRFDLGIGVGSQWEEFQTFGINPKERVGRTWEIVDIIERCLHGNEETFDHEGKYYHFPGVRWIMQPVQKRIPILWGGFGPHSVARAAEREYHLIATDVTGTYERVMRDRGRDPADYLIGFVNRISIGKTREEAFEAVAEPCTWTSNQYALRPSLEGVWPPESARVSVDDIRRAWEAGSYRAAFSVPIAGTVEDVTEHFLKIVRGETGLITHIGVQVREPGTRTEDVHRSMTLFAQEVLPVLRAEATRVEAQRKAGRPISRT